MQATVLPAAENSVASPTATVQQALDLLAKHDEPGLQALFDPAMSDFMRAGNTTEALNAWDTLLHARTDLGGRGAIQQMGFQPVEPRSTDMLVPVLITYERGAARWTFAVRETAQGWRLIQVKCAYLGRT